MFSLAVALVLGAPCVFAHDPGLSTLDVRVVRAEIVAVVSIDPSDVRILSSAAPSGDRLTPLGSWIREAVHVRIETKPLDGVIEEMTSDTSGALHVRLRFSRPAGDLVSIRSSIAERAGRGHRTLISISDDRGRVLAERLTDATGPEVGVSLEMSPANPPVNASPARGARQGDTAIRPGALFTGVSRVNWKSNAEPLAGFFRLGVEHILTGYDHLLFLVGLLLVAWRTRDALVMISAFTAAHSITLALATLALVSAPAQIVEPVIAASMVYVGAENVLRRKPHSRWPVAFGFGLVHGLAFSGALRELGVGQSGGGVAVPLAMFNLGVETGQIAIAALVLPLVRFAQARPALRTRLLPACSVLVAMMGGWWLVERLR
jgi:hydrogenase/urease accessory protein HupE